MSNKLKKKFLDIKFLKNSLIINLIYILYSFVKYSYQSNFHYQKPIKFKSDKKSDTLLILGAGSTINELKKSQIKNFKNYDIAGMSYSIYLSFDQTYFFFESPSINEIESIGEFREKIIPQIDYKFSNKKIKNIIWKNPENNFFNKNLKFKEYKNILVCHILSDNEKVVKRVVKIIEFFNLNRIFLLQKRGSIFSLVMFAKLLGYNRVIFSGIDLNENEYFINDQIYKKYKLKDPKHIDMDDKIHKYKKKLNHNTHFTNDPSIGMPIIKALNILFEENKSIEFLVTSKNSNLSKYINIWK